MFSRNHSFTNSRGRSASRLGRRFNKMPSLDRSTGAGINRRQTSLDREVYYDAENVRKEVVTYKPMENGHADMKLGILSNKYKLSNEDMVKYKTSMSQLCHKMKNISSSSLIAQKQVNSSDATQPLKREILSQARRYNSSTLSSPSRLKMFAVCC